MTETTDKKSPKMAYQSPVTPNNGSLTTSDAVGDVIATHIPHSSQHSTTHRNNSKQSIATILDRQSSLLSSTPNEESVICMGSLFRKLTSIFYFPFKRLAKHSAVKLLILLAGVYLLITFFGLPDYLAINSSPINTLNFRKSEPLSNFDNKIKQLQEQSQQILKKPDQNEHNIVHENELAVYDTNNDAENGGNQPQKSIIHQTCNNYSKNANSNPQKQRLFFLKTHKTGSSTLQAIFFRKALASGKSVMLPREDGKHTFAYPTPFAGYLSDDKCYTQKKCHFLSSHTVFGPKALTAFPKEETSYRKAWNDENKGRF